MPFSLLRRICSLSEPRKRDVAALALTAYARSEDRAEAFRAGFHMFLSKPIDPTEVLLVLASLIGRRRDPPPVST